MSTTAEDKPLTAKQLRELQATLNRARASSGGTARWAGTTKEERSEAMRKAVNARWAKRRGAKNKK